jgi:signal transduction histidine kinase/CHASE2 domain-containing sensor protein
MIAMAVRAARRAILRVCASPAGIALYAALALAGLGALPPIEHRLMDLRFGLIQRPASGDLVVVEIDNASLAALGVWPWPRDLHATVIDRLTAAGARGIAMDVDFSSASTPAADTALADALARAGHRVVLPIFKQHASLARPDSDVRYTAPLPMFGAHAPLASVNLQPGEDGLIRLYSVAEPWDGNLVPSMGALLAAVERPPADAFYLDYGIDAAGLPRVSFADLLHGRADPAQLQGKLVIVGAAAVELGDLAAVPLYRVLPGVAVQALGYESIVQDRMILRSSPMITWSAAVLLAILGGVRFSRWPWRRGLLAVIAGTAGLIAGSLALQAAAPVSLDIVAWIVVLWVSFVAALMRGTDALAIRIYRKGMALLHRTAIMRAVLEDSFDGIIIADDQGRIEHANATAARMVGESADALLGRPAAGLFTTATTGPAGTTQPVPTLLARADGSAVPVELAIGRSELRGSRHPFERRQEGRAIAIWTFRDITERRRGEEAQRTALQEAIAASRAKSEFIANMGHELRTPLNAIIGFSEMLRDQMLGPIGTPAYVSYAADIHTSGTRLRDALNGVLDIARIEGGRYQLDEEAVALAEAVDAAIGTVAEAARQKNTAIDCMLDRGLPMVRVDARAVRQVLVSLLSNAVKFTGDDGRVAIRGGVDGAGDCLLSIADNGIGMPQDQLERVMKPFQQADTSLARKYEGVGLGLSLASGLMQLHGGSLAITSAPNAGTTVTIRFPAVRVLAIDVGEGRPAGQPVILATSP